MNIIYTKFAKEDIKYWQKHNQTILHKIEELIIDIQKTPYSGLGKPEALRFEYSGYWSRRINHEHRLVYKIANNIIFIAQCRYHY